MSHLNILTNNQFGFQQKYFAELQLLQTVRDFTSSLYTKTQTDCRLQ